MVPERVNARGGNEKKKGEEKAKKMKVFDRKMIISGGDWTVVSGATNASERLRS